jgi:hypothetical protein
MDEKPIRRYTRPEPDDISFEKYLETLKKTITSSSVVESDKDLEREEKRQKIYQASQSHEDLLEERRQERNLRESVANRIFKLLVIETSIVFVVLLLQGFRFLGFNINNTSLNIFLPATIIQISSMAVIITNSLFPSSKNK